jgi:perosamine synthetase
MKMRYLAPTGAPIRAGDLARWFRRAPRLARSELELRSAICAHLGRRHCALTCTGRAGLVVLLSALRSLAPRDRDEVIVPSYTCYSVAASAIRAGLRPRVVDVCAASLDFDLEKLGNANFRRTLAIVTTNIYGFPSRMPLIQGIARDNSVFLVDDAAQSLGASVAGQPSGAWGDAGLLSFDKGKPLSAIDGGAVTTDADDIARAVAHRVSQLSGSGMLKAIQSLAKVGVYSAFLRPWLYWIPNAVAGLGLGQTVYRSDFAIQSASPWLAGLAATMWPRLGEYTATRSANAQRYRAGLPSTNRLTIVTAVEGANPSYLRFPILVNDSGLRAQLLRGLHRAGIGATTSYPASIADVPGIQPHLAGAMDARVGRSIADRIITLPTHPYVSTRDVDTVLGLAADLLAQSASAARAGGH